MQRAIARTLRWALPLAALLTQASLHLLAATAYTPVPAPAGALGYPSRAPDLDALPGFRTPPPGYGQVPFWWWTGDPIDRDRLLWQIEELHRKGISGVQVNYAHEDTPGWPTYPAEPPIFSDAWWDVWKFVAGECGKRDMGIGLSGYTLDWPNGRSLVSRTIYSDSAITGRELKLLSRTPAPKGKPLTLTLPPQTVSVWAYPLTDGRLHPDGLALQATNGVVEWTPPNNDWEVWVFGSEPKPGSLNPMHPESGQRVIAQFFQRFQDHAPEQSAKGLNYFFHDELQFGVGDHIWTDDLPEQFQARKGYNLFQALPALFADIGPRTPKARMDYMDVRMQLIQERYFIPIFEWHWSRGLIYGCDQGSRGRDPLEFGDYFSAVRWYTAPGHDTPGGHADLIKGKVSSSIAHLYQRPRVWLEGYHSLGWGAAPERLMQATCENYLYGCNLLNLHGLYYTTHGSFWEWAPPCYHFRMPYWDHMGVFLKYFERLSYLLSQGVHQADVAVLYPVTTGQAGLGGGPATDLAFQAGTRLFENGRDFIYIDDESIQRAEIAPSAPFAGASSASPSHPELRVAGGAYRALVLPAMRAMRWGTLQKIRQFQQSGGIVIALGALPEASDRAGREDPELQKLVLEAFGSTPATLEDLLPRLQAIPRDVTSPQPVKAVRRKVGFRDVYFVLGARRGQECTFRATGRVEWWDPWTGETHPIYGVQAQGPNTRVRMPLTETEAQLIVFSPGTPDVALTDTDLDDITFAGLRNGQLIVQGYSHNAGARRATVTRAGAATMLTGQAAPATLFSLDGDWEFELKPTMDNRWGDFRLPALDPVIGAEARAFRYAEELNPNPGWQAADLDDSAWRRVESGFGQKFWRLGPLPADNRGDLDAQLAALDHIDPARPVNVGGTNYLWQPYNFSWRWGVRGDPGHQGWHGLKENVSDDFIRLGKPREGHNEILYEAEPAGMRYYLWTSAHAANAVPARLHAGGLLPAALYVRGRPVSLSDDVPLQTGPNPILVRYDAPGRGHLVFQDATAQKAHEPTPLAMKWLGLPGVIPFDPHPQRTTPVGWYRFTAPPGLRALRVSSRGGLEAWVNGNPCRVETIPTASPEPGVRTFRVTAPTPAVQPATVALRITHDRGASGGSALPEPAQLDCGPGQFRTGDWSKGSALEHYSGGAWYRNSFSLTPDQLQGRALLDLGDVVATAEVRVNGALAGIRVAPPWVVDLSPHLRAGENRLEVLVYNTLANHYSSIPSKYQGSLRSGLIGPVRLKLLPLVSLAE